MGAAIIREQFFSQIDDLLKQSGDLAHKDTTLEELKRAYLEFLNTKDDRKKDEEKEELRDIYVDATLHIIDKQIEAIQAEIEETNKRIRDLELHIEKNNSEIYQINRQLPNLYDKILNIERMIDENRSQINLLDQEIETHSTQINVLSDEIAEMKRIQDEEEETLEGLRKIAANDPGAAHALHILSGGKEGKLMEGYTDKPYIEMADFVADRDKQRAGDIRDKRAEIDVRLEQIAAIEVEQAKLQAQIDAGIGERADIQAEIDKLEARKEVLLQENRELESELSDAREHLDELEARRADLEAQRSDLAKQQPAAAPQAPPKVGGSPAGTDGALRPVFAANADPAPEVTQIAEPGALAANDPEISNSDAVIAAKAATPAVA
jgi:chromosome segregation ATPase